MNINTISFNKIIFAKLKYLIYNKRVVNFYAMVKLSKMNSKKNPVSDGGVLFVCKHKNKGLGKILALFFIAQL